MKENCFLLPVFFLQLHINTTEHVHPLSTSLLQITWGVTMHLQLAG